MIVIAGGTGTLGQRLVPRLVERGLPVRVFTRDASRARGLAQGDFEVCVGDVRDRERAAEAVQNAAAVISSIHGFIGTGGVTPESVDRDGNAHLISAAARNRAAFMLISAIGTAPDHPWELMRAKHAAEENLRQSGVPYAIIRPSAFTETWGTMMLSSLQTSGRIQIFGRGNNPSNYVSVIDVAALIESVITGERLGSREIDFGGPDTLTFNQLAAIVQDVAGRQAAVRHIPRPVLRAMSHVARPLNPQLARQSRGAVVLDTIDMSFDPRPARREFPDVPETDVREALKKLLNRQAPAKP
jgi:NADH dehydrogenase